MVSVQVEACRHKSGDNHDGSGAKRTRVKRNDAPYPFERFLRPDSDRIPCGTAAGKSRLRRRVYEPVWDRAVVLLNDKTDAAIRTARFRELFRTDFDCPGIARFVLGRYWRNASNEEQQEFVKLFEDYVVFVYTARLSNFGDEIIKVRGSRRDGDGDGANVSTDMISAGSTTAPAGFTGGSAAGDAVAIRAKKPLKRVRLIISLDASSFGA